MNKLRRLNWTGHSKTHDRDTQLYKISVRKPKGYFQMGDTRREEDNINIGKRYRAAALELIIQQELKDLEQVNLS